MLPTLEPILMLPLARSLGQVLVGAAHPAAATPDRPSRFAGGNPPGVKVNGPGCIVGTSNCFYPVFEMFVDPRLSSGGAKRPPPRSKG